ncbi:MAG TPA: M20/M25/M40 family metallo-hydrolase [Pyrinomonadaceae bacterium]|jgi:acetylornithine deacetylase|nr:M20/M25/M40 family metallo-hydrolase [Pyrinomonadaceae bacterium]
MNRELFALTRKLIDIPSLTGDEGAVGSFLAKHLEDLGYRVEKQEIAAGRFNILATTEDPPHVVLSTHMDTVPPFMRSGEDDEYIHGRGSCDAKGIIAAQIFAAEELRSKGMQNLGLLFTVDEELSSEGAQAANKHPLARECRYLINGEPTDNRIAIGTKGSMRLMITTTGRAGHSAYPEFGESAIEKLLDILEDIRAIEWPEDSFFGSTTCNIGVIEGGTRPNVIPDHARAQLQIRLGIDIEQVKGIVERTIGGRAEIEYASAHNPVRLSSSVFFQETTIVRFTTDIPYLSNWGKPVLLGPGSILDAHTDHERVSKRELDRAVHHYVKLARVLSEYGCD